jgi:hypothetical protein
MLELSSLAEQNIICSKLTLLHGVCQSASSVGKLCIQQVHCDITMYTDNPERYFVLLSSRLLCYRDKLLPNNNSMPLGFLNWRLVAYHTVYPH